MPTLRITLPFLCLFLANNLSAQEVPDFRSSSWGDSIQSVIEAEGTEPLKRHFETQSISYVESLLGVEFEVIYAFEGGRLIRGVYKWLPEFDLSPDGKAELDRYRKLEDVLTAKYGPTSSSGPHPYWKNKQSIPDSANWGAALVAEEITFGSLRKLERTEIEHDLFYLDSGAFHRIIYRNLEGAILPDSKEDLLEKL